MLHGAPREAALVSVSDLLNRKQKLFGAHVPLDRVASSALAASLRECTNVTSLLLCRSHATAALRVSTGLQLDTREFGALVSLAASRASDHHQSTLLKLSTRPDVLSLTKRTEGALVCTLGERTQKTAWESKPAVRLAGVLALYYTEEASTYFNAILNGLVRTDTRRIDELQSSLSMQEAPLLLLTEIIDLLTAVSYR